MRTSRLLIKLGGVGLLALPLQALAYSFIPTEAEWASWPRYCQSRYVTTNIGQQSQFHGSFPSSETEAWIDRISKDVWEDVHHYCAGLIYLQRAKLETDPWKRKHLLEDGRGEALYTYARVPPDCAICGQIAVTLAMIEKDLGRVPQAIDVLKKQIENKPRDPGPYSALAVLYREQDQLDLALQTLQSGDEACEKKCPEIAYNLGLLSIDINDLDAAVEYARRAYELGHPLPGLRNKLRRLGVWETAQAAR